MTSSMVYSHADKGDVKPKRPRFRAIGGSLADTRVATRSRGTAKERQNRTQLLRRKRQKFWQTKMWKARARRYFCRIIIRAMLLATAGYGYVVKKKVQRREHRRKIEGNRDSVCLTFSVLVSTRLWNFKRSNLTKLGERLCRSLALFYERRRRAATHPSCVRKSENFRSKSNSQFWPAHVSIGCP
jgi:hypothetical protein